MVKNKEMFISGKGGQGVFLRVWDNISEPKAVLQIFHGMAEHSGRYEVFAEFLNNNGIIVYANDHRGHGKTAENNGQLGYLGKNGFYNVMEDEHIITSYIKEIHKDLPVIIFAHSFGSFIGQEYITKYSNEIDAVILSGSAKNHGPDVEAGIIVSSLQSRFVDDKKPAKFIDNFAFGGFNKNIENPPTKVAWLTRDEKEQKKYLEDKYCSFVPTINFYKNLFDGLSKLYDKNKLEQINKELPILVLSGEKDPVGKNGESVKKLYEQYKELNIKDVEIKLFKDARHELLNEINKEEVFEFIHSWISKVYSKKFITK